VGEKREGEKGEHWRSTQWRHQFPRVWAKRQNFLGFCTRLHLGRNRKQRGLSFKESVNRFQHELLPIFRKKSGARRGFWV
jgi:hypothetical protein